MLLFDATKQSAKGLSPFEGSK